MEFKLNNRDLNFFETWKEFAIQKPDEQILNHYDVVRSHTDINGKLKYNDNDIIKVFSLFITHNYGSYIYEICHFLKYIDNIKKDLFYELMIKNSSQIIDQIKKYELSNKNSLSGQFTLEMESKTFDMSYKRVSSLLVILDFLEEFLGLEEVVKFYKKISFIKSQSELSNISNELSRTIYDYLKNLIPTSYLQSYANAISNEILKEYNNENHLIVSEDISDDFILNFWIKFSEKKSTLLIKTFSLAAEICLMYRKSIDCNKFQFSHIVNDNVNGEPWNHVSKEEADIIMDGLLNESRTNLNNSISYIEEMQNEKLNILKKNQIYELKIFSKYNLISLELPLTILRVVIYGNIQNKIIESERRQSFETIAKIKSKNSNLNYLNKILFYRELIESINFVKGIVFFKLWIFDAPETLQFIRYFFNKEELQVFDSFIIENIDHEMEDTNVSLKMVEILKKFKIIHINNIENKIFYAFRNKIKLLKKQSSSFRRSGFNDIKTPKETIEFYNNSYKSLIEINDFLNNFLKSIKLKIENHETQFLKDEDIFLNQFSIIHNIGSRL
tara:strand:- start:1889 stop:3562 length:1674 start_codon:yes stop_codon:yes gene_type:complete